MNNFLGYCFRGLCGSGNGGRKVSTGRRVRPGVDKYREAQRGSYSSDEDSDYEEDGEHETDIYQNLAGMDKVSRRFSQQVWEQMARKGDKVNSQSKNNYSHEESDSDSSSDSDSDWGRTYPASHNVTTDVSVNSVVGGNMDFSKVTAREREVFSELTKIEQPVTGWTTNREDRSLLNELQTKAATLKFSEKTKTDWGTIDISNTYPRSVDALDADLVGLDRNSLYAEAKGGSNLKRLVNSTINRSFEVVRPSRKLPKDVILSWKEGDNVWTQGSTYSIKHKVLEWVKANIIPLPIPIGTFYSSRIIDKMKGGKARGFLRHGRAEIVGTDNGLQDAVAKIMIEDFNERSGNQFVPNFNSWSEGSVSDALKRTLTSVVESSIGETQFEMVRNWVERPDVAENFGQLAPQLQLLSALEFCSLYEVDTFSIWSFFGRFVAVTRLLFPQYLRKDGTVYDLFEDWLLGGNMLKDHHNPVEAYTLKLMDQALQMKLPNIVSRNWLVTLMENWRSLGLKKDVVVHLTRNLLLTYDGDDIKKWENVVNLKGVTYNNIKMLGMVDVFRWWEVNGGDDLVLWVIPETCSQVCVVDEKGYKARNTALGKAKQQQPTYHKKDTTPISDKGTTTFKKVDTPPKKEEKPGVPAEAVHKNHPNERKKWLDDNRYRWCMKQAFAGVKQVDMKIDGINVYELLSPREKVKIDEACKKVSTEAASGEGPRQRVRSKRPNAAGKD